MKTQFYDDKIRKVGGREASGWKIRLCLMLLLGVFLIGSVSAILWDNTVYWKFDEASGTIYDSVGNVNLTASATPLYNQAGKINGAIGFNSDGDCFSNSTSAKSFDFNSTVDMTFNFWVKIVTYTGSDRIFFRGKPGDGTIDFNQYENQNLTIGLVKGIKAYYVIDNNWHMITRVRNNSGQDHYLFVDGKYNSSALGEVAGSFVTSTSTVIGDCRTDRYPNAFIDEFGFWKRALTQAQIIGLYNGSSGNPCSYGDEACVSGGGTISVNLNSPIDYYNTTTSQVVFNVSALVLSGGQTIQNVSLYLDGILNQTNTSGTNGTYIFTKYISSGTHNWSILAYDNNSISTQSSTRFLTFGIFENSRTFSASKTEGTSGTFVLNLSVVSQVTLAYLNYNGTLKATNILAGAFTTLTSTFTIPSVLTDTNVTFFWIVYTPLQNFNSTTSNQTILNIAIDNCTVNKVVLYNFTIVDEITQTKLVGSTGNTSGKINLQIYPFANYNAIFTNYSTFFNMTNPFSICLNSTLIAGDKFSIDAQIEYDALLNTKEYYYIQNDTLELSYLNNNITLYDLDDTKAQTFKIVYLDSSGIPVEDALIEIQRQYVDEGVFKIVEIAKTDKDGETQAKLQLNDVVYTFVVKKYGRVIDTFNKKFVRCDNYVYNVCEIKLNSFSSYIQTEDYTKGDDFEFTLTYTRATRTITSVFNIPSGSSSLIVLNATLLDNLGTTLACSSSITSSSGTLNCVVPNAIGNGTVYAQIFKDGVLQGSGDVSLNTKASDIYGASLVFLLIFLYLTLIGMGVGDSPMVMGVFMILGVILAVALNLVDTGASKFFGAGATILWFIIAVVIVLIKGGKR